MQGSRKLDINNALIISYEFYHYCIKQRLITT